MITLDQLPLVWLGIFGNDTLRYLIAAALVSGALGLAPAEWVARRRIQPRRARGTDVRREIRHSVLTAGVFASVGLATVSLREAGLLRIYGEVEAFGWTYAGASLPLLLVLHDTYFYWVHRLMHHPRLFRHFHRVHHLSRAPTPWAAYAFAPGEALLMTAFVPLATALVPVHHWVLFVFLAVMILRNALGHCGVEVHPRWWIDTPLDLLTTVTHHDLHHQRFDGNYGLYFTWWDRLLGTELPEYRAAFHDASPARASDARDRQCGPRAHTDAD